MSTHLGCVACYASELHCVFKFVNKYIFLPLVFFVVFSPLSKVRWLKTAIDTLVCDLCGSSLLMRPARNVKLWISIISPQQCFLWTPKKILRCGQAIEAVTFRRKARPSIGSDPFFINSAPCRNIDKGSRKNKKQKDDHSTIPNMFPSVILASEACRSYFKRPPVATVITMVQQYLINSKVLALCQSQIGLFHWLSTFSSWWTVVGKLHSVSMSGCSLLVPNGEREPNETVLSHGSLANNQPRVQKSGSNEAYSTCQPSRMSGPVFKNRATLFRRF